MSDSANARVSARASTFMNRPQIVPMGPRTRQSSSGRASMFMEHSNAIASPPVTGLDLPEFGERDTPMSPTRMSTSPSPSPASPEPSVLSSRRSLAILEEESSSPEVTPAYLSDDSISVETPIQTPIAKVTAIVAAPKLIPPPAIKFQTTTISWKGLPMEAALWTVDSQELQELVSRAIRASARESFIRLLTIDNLDTILPAELTRLDELKAKTQSRYRFLVHRRTMLFHALNSTSLAQQKDGDDGVPVVARLASQLAETITECEQHLEEVININDQIAQINKLIDMHWGSALAIALRKLNGSYARRTSELKETKERIKQLEGELEDAWKEAEKVAGELDEYEAAIEADNTEAIIETAEIVPVPKLPAANRRSSIPMPMTPTLLAFTPSGISTTPRALSPTSPPSPHSPQFIFPPVFTLQEKQTEATDVPDTVSVRSARSTRSGKSGRSRKSSWTVESTSHSASVQAAKKRSQRASQSSLRLSIGNRRHSRGRAKTPQEDQPPVPELPLHFLSHNGLASTSTVKPSTFMNFDTNINPVLRRKGSLDSVLTTGTLGRTPITATSQQGRAADDLYIRMKNQNPSALDIQMAPRTPAGAHQFASTSKSTTFPSRQPRQGPSSSIPSMWMNADVVKPQIPQPTPSATSSPQTSTISSDPVRLPLQRQASTKTTTYSKLRGLTKRYSVSLPLFNTKPSQNWSISRRSG